PGDPVDSALIASCSNPGQENAMTGRRNFLTKASGAAVAVTAATIIDAPNVIAQSKVQWRMSTAWTPANDLLQGAALRLAKVVQEASGGGFPNQGFPGGPSHPPVEGLARPPTGARGAFQALSSFLSA